MKANDYNSYQGVAIAVAETDTRGVVRLLRCDSGTPFVVHVYVHPTTSFGGEGALGHYFYDIEEAWEDFEERAGDVAVFYNLDDPRVEEIVRAKAN